MDIKTKCGPGNKEIIETGGTVMCNGCGEMFANSRGLANHKTRPSTTYGYVDCEKSWSIASRTCKECGCQFSSMKSLNAHKDWCSLLQD